MRRRDGTGRGDDHAVGPRRLDRQGDRGLPRGAASHKTASVVAAFPASPLASLPASLPAGTRLRYAEGNPPTRVRMDDKALQTLEFDKVLARLAALTAFAPSRERALALRPSDDLGEVVRRQRQTAEARRLLRNRPNMSIGGARDVR